MNAASPDPTPRQRSLLEMIEQYLARHGRPPTRADLADAMGLRNRQGIEQHLRALAAKGFIALAPGVSRNIRLLQPTFALTRRLPLYGRVAAGVPTLAQGNVEDELMLDPALFRPRADFLLRVHGASMIEADIRDRDILAIHRTTQASNGQIVVARLGDEATVKYYRRKGHLLRLEPANAAFRPIEVDLRHQHCSIEGLVVGLLRSGMPQVRKP
ncbi:MAG: transcriptional repressor LexA [Steroidobacteraceae bacterium]